MSFDTGFDDAFDAPQDEEQSDTTRLLIRARGFVERGWCKGIHARDHAGNESAPRSRLAVSWCARGALVAAGMTYDPFHKSHEQHPAYIRLRNAMGEDPSDFSERQNTVEPVLEAFDRAIAAGNR